jgi:hypothetical protein
VAQATRIARVLGWRQASYLARLMGMFADGELDDALRHAIPLGSGGADRESSGPMLGVPSARKTLQLSTRLTPASSTLGLPAPLLAELRRLYTQAAARLEQQGRYDEAAFALAELLQDAAAAVSLLERHQRFQLAAELAEGRSLAPTLVIRQWLLAGNADRAVSIARRTHSFSAAITLLERSASTQALAAQLRIIWAEMLAEAGDFGGAVMAMRPLAEGRGLLLKWLEIGVGAGGVMGARLLAQKAHMAPDAFDAVASQARALLRDASADGAPARLAFATELSTAAPHASSSALAKLALRALARDAELELTAPNPSVLRKLEGLIGSDPMVADLPPLHRAAKPVPVEKSHLRVLEGDRGLLEVFDVIPLSGGRMLVALGEAGVRLVTRDGRTAAHFDVPAHQLALSTKQTQALALAPRGGAVRVSRIDLVQRRTALWWEGRLDAWSKSFDEAMWFVAQSDSVIGLDTLSPRMRALWRVGDLQGRVLQLGSSTLSVAFLVDKGDVVERWAYAGSYLGLRTRDELVGAGSRRWDPRTALALDGWGNALGVLRGDAEEDPVRLFRTGPAWEPMSLRAGFVAGAPLISGNLAIVPFYGQDRCEVEVVDLGQRRVRATLVFEGRRGEVRGATITVPSELQERALIVWDRTGVVVSIDRTTFKLVGNLRLS